MDSIAAKSKLESWSQWQNHKDSEKEYLDKEEKYI